MRQVERELQVITKAIIRGYRPEQIVLFGSAARGRFRRASDLDLLIVKNTRRKPMERVRDVARILPHTIDTDIVVLTPQEFAARRRERHYLLEDMLREGRILYVRRKT